MKSVTSAPALKPPPIPPMPSAEGADQVPSSFFATTTPEPARAVRRKPRRKMEKMAKPLARRRTVRGMMRSRPFTGSTKSLKILSAAESRMRGWRQDQYKTRVWMVARQEKD